MGDKPRLKIFYHFVIIGIKRNILIIRKAIIKSVVSAPLPGPDGETEAFALASLTYDLLRRWTGSGAAVSMQYGSGETEKMRQSVFQSFLLIAGIALVLNLLVYLGLNGILWLLRVPVNNKNVSTTAGTTSVTLLKDL